MSVWSEEEFEVVHQHFHGQDAPAFESEEMQQHVWGRRWGVFNDVGTLKAVMLHRPGDEMLEHAPSRRAGPGTSGGALVFLGRAGTRHR